jgi:hypothetical protein
VSALIEYDDVRERTYRTRVMFDIGNNAYESRAEDFGGMPEARTHDERG